MTPVRERLNNLSARYPGGVMSLAPHNLGLYIMVAECSFIGVFLYRCVPLWGFNQFDKSLQNPRISYLTLHGLIQCTCLFCDPGPVIGPVISQRGVLLYL